MSLIEKFNRLILILKKLEDAVLAYSGGVDSSFLLAIARERLKRLIAVTAKSPTLPSEELNFAKEFCQRLGISHKIIITQELRNKNFTDNPPERCYFCKRELFSQLAEIAKRNGIKNIIDASNVDDKKDYRPGEKARKEFGVISPLQEAGLNKQEIRFLSRRLGLVTWNKPQQACLASRIAYGEKITKEKLKRIETAESLIKRNLKIKGNLRVRLHNDVARIEVDNKIISRIIKNREFILKLKNLGFKYITVDLEGYRTGSMNII